MAAVDETGMPCLGAGNAKARCYLVRQLRCARPLPTAPASAGGHVRCASRALLTPCIGDCGMRTRRTRHHGPGLPAACCCRPGCRPAPGHRIPASSRPATDVCGMPADAVGIALALAARSPAVLADGCAHGSRTISVRKWRANGKKHGRHPGLRQPLLRSPRTATRPDSGHRLPDTGRRTPASASRVRNQERQQS